MGRGVCLSVSVLLCHSLSICLCCIWNTFQNGFDELVLNRFAFWFAPHCPTVDKASRVGWTRLRKAGFIRKADQRTFNELKTAPMRPPTTPSNAKIKYLEWQMRHRCKVSDLLTTRSQTFAWGRQEAIKKHKMLRVLPWQAGRQVQSLEFYLWKHLTVQFLRTTVSLLRMYTFILRE